MVAAPAHDGANNVWHTCALVNTAKQAIMRDINIIPIYMSYDSLVQRARNDIVKLALQMEVDDLVFIDTDQDWDVDDFFKLIEHDVDVVGVPIRKKSDEETYNVKLLREYKVLENGLVDVDSVGTGMLRLTRKALLAVWNDSEEYLEQGKGMGRMVFSVEIVGGVLCSEDVILCKKLNDNGIRVYIDPTLNAAHSGHKRWIGDFDTWIGLVTTEPKPTLQEMKSMKEF